MSPSLTERQLSVARQLAGIDPPDGRPLPGVLNALSAKGCRRPDGLITPLGMVAVNARGWVPDARQQRLLVALADGTVHASNRYRPRCAPTVVLESLCDLGLARVVRRYRRYTGTALCQKLALGLRQQPLPPPVGPEREVRP